MRVVKTFKSVAVGSIISLLIAAVESNACVVEQRLRLDEQPMCNANDFDLTTCVGTADLLESSNWGYQGWLESSLISVSICSIISFLCSYFMSVTGFLTPRHMSNLLFYGAGAMLADFFLHIVPHSLAHLQIGGHQHGHHHHGHHAHDHHAHISDQNSHSIDMLFMYVLAGIVATQILDMSISAVKEHILTEIQQQKITDVHGVADTGKQGSKDGPAAADSVKTAVLSFCAPALNIQPVAFMNLAFDFIHNFSDAITICAAFRVSRRLGIMTSLSTFAHELAQELSDFALLVHSGLSANAALLLNVGASFSAYLGVIATVYMGLDEWDSKASVPLLFFSGGAILRIALVEMIPGAIKELPPKKLGCVIMNGLSLSAGIGSLYLVSAIESFTSI
eukprot:Selendium_serpulae@DN5914_c0_g1_i1.p1